LGQTGPSIVNTPSAPARIVSFLEKPSDALAAVTVASNTSRTITSVKLGVIMTVPKLCGSTSYTGPEQVYTRMVELAPNSATTMTDFHLSYEDIRRLQARFQAKDTVSQIAVVGVTFANGEQWSLTRSGTTYNDEDARIDANLRCAVTR